MAGGVPSWKRRWWRVWERRAPSQRAEAEHPCCHPAMPVWPCCRARDPRLGGEGHRRTRGREGGEGAPPDQREEGRRGRAARLSGRRVREEAPGFGGEGIRRRRCWGSE